METGAKCGAIITKCKRQQISLVQGFDSYWLTLGLWESTLNISAKPALIGNSCWLDTHSTYCACIHNCIWQQETQTLQRLITLVTVVISTSYSGLSAFQNQNQNTLSFVATGTVQLVMLE